MHTLYNPATDFLGLWRNIAGNVSKMEMPGLDYVVAALARAGLISVSVSGTAPVVNQPTTAWLLAAVPSSSAEGALFLWDKVTATYVAATPGLFLQLLEAAAGENGASWYTVAGGAPLNTLGLNGDFAIRTDEPGGIYGPKAAGAWPANPIPGTTDIIGSTQLDLTFGNTEGALIRRGAAVWEALKIGAANTILVSDGALQKWSTVWAWFDSVFGTQQGDVLYRASGNWQSLGPGVAGQIFSTGGPGANPSWVSRTAEFPSGTVMLFQQTAAPTGWTKQTALNDYGLRVTSGAVGSVAGSAFSTVFAQTTVGNTTLTSATMPSHTHTSNANTQNAFSGTPGPFTTPSVSPQGATINAVGGDGAHSHSVNLTLSYVDVIIASKN